MSTVIFEGRNHLTVKVREGGKDQFVGRVLMVDIDDYRYQPIGEMAGYRLPKQTFATQEEVKQHCRDLYRDGVVRKAT